MLLRWSTVIIATPVIPFPAPLQLPANASDPSLPDLKITAARPSVLPSLDSHGNTVDLFHSDDAGQRHLFKHCLPDRQFWAALLPRIDLDLQRVKNFLNCGRYARIQYSEKLSRLRIVSSACGMRICPRCGPTRRSKSAVRIASMVTVLDNRQWKFITLTVVSSPAPLSAQLDHLTASFRRFRQTKLWTSRTRFGKAIIEVSFNHDLNLWHPHLHVLVNTPYIPQKALSAQWLKCTGGSPIVDIRVLESKSQTAKYVTKYLGKLPDFASMKEPERFAADFYFAMTRRTLVLHFGQHPDLPADDPEDYSSESDAGWSDVGSLERILAYAKKGRAWACEIMTGLDAKACLQPKVDNEIFSEPP